MDVKKILIVVAIVLGLVGSIVASMFASVEGCTRDTDDCVRAMVEEHRHAGWLGLDTARPDGKTLTVVGVTPGSPAEAAGFAVGDVLMELEGIAYADANKNALKRLKASQVPGSEVTYTVARSGERITVRVRLGRVPKKLIYQLIGQHVVEAHARIELAAS